MTTEQIKNLARPFVEMTRAIEDFFRQEETVKAFERWLKDKEVKDDQQKIRK